MAKLTTSRLAVWALGALGAALLPTLVGAAPRIGLPGVDFAPRGAFSLGRSAKAGVTCAAARDYGDPAGIGKGRRVYQVTCTGWANEMGRIYVLPSASDAGDGGLWRKTLSARADCDFAASKPAADVPGATAVTCKSKPAGVGYVAIVSGGKGRVIAADGLDVAADVLATGIKVVSGEMAPPRADQAEPVVVAASSGSFAEAANAAASSELSKERAYKESQAWQFASAETRFVGLASAEGLSAEERADAALNSALNVSNEGRFDEAESYFETAEALVKAADRRWLDALRLNYLAMHARNQRRFDDAIDYANQALELRRKSTSAGGTTVTFDQNNQPVIPGGLATQINVKVRSLTDQLSAEDKEDLRDAQAYQVIGTAYHRQRKRDEARSAFLQAQSILERPYKGGKLGSNAPWLTARVEADLAALDRELGDSELAVTRLEKSLDEYQKRYGPDLAAGGFMIELARSRSAAKDDAKALEDYERAFEIFRVNRGALGASADFVGNYFAILLGRIGDDPAAHKEDVARFFASSESLVSLAASKAALQNSARIAAGNSDAAAQVRAYQQIQRDLQIRDAQKRQLIQGDEYKGDLRAAFETENARLKAEEARIRQLLLDKYPSYAAVVDPRVELPALQAALKPGEAYLKVLLLENGGYGMLITPTEARPYRVDLTRSQALAASTKMRASIDRLREGQPLGAYDVATARDIYRRMLGPVDARLAGVKHLIYQPDPVLIGVPLGALVIDDESVAASVRNVEEARRTRRQLSYKGISWLEAKLETSVAISTASFSQIRKTKQSEAPKAFRGFADPVIGGSDKAFASVATPSARLARTAGGSDYCAQVREALLLQPPLPQTRSEVQAIAASLGAEGSFLVGPDFTDDRVRSEGGKDGGLDQYRVLYFATHGILPPENACMSPSLVTSVGAGESDALLDVKEIPNLSLDAELVVLSACDTAANAGDSGSDGASVGGLTTAFTQAGARNLLVSNWPVDTVATEVLMTGMFKARSGNQIEALAAAQRRLRDSDGKYGHPYYWAAFTLIGDGARMMPGL